MRGSRWGQLGEAGDEGGGYTTYGIHITDKDQSCYIRIAVPLSQSRTQFQ